jgi:hypothetical protein
MAGMSSGGVRRQLMARLREYEGHVKRFEGQLLILRGRAERASGEAAEKLATLLADLEREAEGLRQAGRAAVEGMERAVGAGQAVLEGLKGKLAEAGVAAPGVLAKGKAAVRRASIEAQALRHGVRVGLRVARRTAKRQKAGKA